MYWKSFALREDPFGLTPDSRFLFLSEAHSEVLSTLREGIEAERGLVALVSQPGLGKTTLLHALREQLAGQAVTALVFQSGLDPLATLRMLLKELGLDASHTDPLKMHEQFKEGLARVADLGKQFVLFIDEAQGLSPATLETIRLLSNFETGRKKMVEIVLSGQPEMEHLLARPGLEHIRQRVSVFCRLKPLTRTESVQYLQHRLNVAGASGPAIFNDEALQVLALFGKGIPRTLNIYAFQAMLKASKRRRPWREIEPAFVRETIHLFEGWGSTPDESARELHVTMAAPLVAPRSVTPPQPMHVSTAKAEQDDFFAGETDPALQELLNSLRQESSKAVQAKVDLTEYPPFVPSGAPHEPLKIMPSFIASAAAPAPALDPVPTWVSETSPVISPVPAPAAISPEAPTPKLVLAVMPSREPAKVAPDSDTEKIDSALPTSTVEAKSAERQRPLQAQSERSQLQTTADGLEHASATVIPHAHAAPLGELTQQKADRSVLRWPVAALALVSLSAGVWLVARELGVRRTEATAAIHSSGAPVRQAVPVAPMIADPQSLQAKPVKNQLSPQTHVAPSGSAATPSPRITQSSTVTHKVSAAEIAAGSAKRFDENSESPAPAVPISAIGSSAMPNFGSALKTSSSDSVSLQPLITPAVPDQQPRPDYPMMAKRLRLSGEVVLKVQVNKQGRATSVQVVSGNPVLAAAAQNSVKNFWRFRPATMNGEPIDGEAQVRVVYRQGEN